MTTPHPLDQLTQALSGLAAADAALDRIAAARQIREAAEELEQTEVKSAREHGTSWSKIGAAYGLTKQGAQQRFGDERRRKQAPEATKDEAPTSP